MHRLFKDLVLFFCPTFTQGETLIPYLFLHLFSFYFLNKLGTLVHACNCSALEVKARDHESEVSGSYVMRICIKNILPPKIKIQEKNFLKKATFGWLCFYLEDGDIYNAGSMLLERCVGFFNNRNNPASRGRLFSFCLK